MQADDIKLLLLVTLPPVAVYFAGSGKPEENEIMAFGVFFAILGWVFVFIEDIQHIYRKLRYERIGGVGQAR